MLLVHEKSPGDGDTRRLSEKHPRTPVAITPCPDIVCVGDLAEAAGTRWRFGLDHFVTGALPDLLRFSEAAAHSQPYDRYVIVTSLGAGRSLVGPLKIERNAGQITVECEVAPDFPRILATDLPTDFALSAQHDLTGSGNIETVSGLDALPQTLLTCLSMMRGESPFHPDYGSRLSEYWQAYFGSPWLNALIKLDVARLASIPYGDPILNQQYTPLRCVERVEDVQVLGPPEAGRLPVRLKLIIAGVGAWSRDLRIFVDPTRRWASGVHDGFQNP